MTGLLVSSLMADGGLKTSLLTAIKVEMAELEKTGEKEDKEGDTLITERAQLESESQRAAEESGRLEERTSTITSFKLSSD